MKCPSCQAKLLPVDGEMFCLQCGRTVHEVADAEDIISLEETEDPLLQRAIRDAGQRNMKFSDEQAAPQPVAGKVKAAEQHRPVKSKMPAKEATQTEVKPVKAAGPVKTAAAGPRHSFASMHMLLVPPRAAAASGGFVSALAADFANQGQRLRSLAQAPAELSQSTVKAWAWVFTVFAIFLAANLGVTRYFADRVYPGVKVDNIAVGGWTFAQLREELPQRLERSPLEVTVNWQAYPVGETAAGLQQAALVRSIEQAGRQTPLPLVGMVGSFFLPPISPQYAVSDAQLNGVLDDIAARYERAPADAAIVVSGRDVFLLADKTGTALDRAAAKAAIRQAYAGTAKTVKIALQDVKPQVTAGQLAGDVTAAQALINQTVQLTVRKNHYSLTAEQIAGWITFAGPGKGAAVSRAGVVGFVNGIPGSFDRSGTVEALLTLLNSHQGGSLTASTRKITTVAAEAPAAQNVIHYSYCIDPSAAENVGLADVLNTTLGPASAWSFGGKVSFSKVAAHCNFMVHLGDTSALAKLNSQCGTQTACRIHNDLAISERSWQQMPAGWSGSLETYRQELVNHVTGQWLGFDHAACGATNASPLTAPHVEVPGCSPDWYPVAPELQDTKILAGF